MIKDVIIHKITSSRGRYSGGSTHGQGTKKSRQGLDPCRHEAVQAARQGEHTDARHGPEARPHAGGGAAEGEPGRHFPEADEPVSVQPAEKMTVRSLPAVIEPRNPPAGKRSEEHTSELQSLR